MISFLFQFIYSTSSYFIMSNDSIYYSYSFDDILISPNFSTVRSRKLVSLAVQLTKSIRLNIPIISSPMDTVTESSMAVAMAMNGGLGVIHRFQSIASQATMVQNVKRHISYVIENPYTVNSTCSLSELESHIIKHNVSSFLVVDPSNKKCVGIVSKKDRQLNELSDNPLSFVHQIMTPLSKLHFLHSYDYQRVIDLCKTHNIEKIPILNQDHTISGLVVFKNLYYFHQYRHVASLDSNGQLLVGAAIGAQGDYLERAEALVNAGVDILSIDTANGYNQMVYDAIQTLKQKFPNIPLIAGNVCTPDGYEFLCKAGADCIRIGIGNGSICSTRLETGIGMCQFSALLECSRIAKKYNVPMLSDGGHTGKVGNKFKALAAGAACVHLGRSLAGTDESPGLVIFKKGRRFKYYRGMASNFANLSKQEKLGITSGDFHVEGVEGEVEYKGSVKDELQRICNGIRSGMSYLGYTSISELHSSPVRFTRISSSGYQETLTRV